MLWLTCWYTKFKNDVGFFKSRSDYSGISGRSILSSFVCSFIIMLYLLDSEYTSRIVLGSVVVGCVIEVCFQSFFSKSGGIMAGGIG